MCPGFVPPCPWANGPPAGSACGDISRVPEVGARGRNIWEELPGDFAAGLMQQTWRFLMILTKQKWWFGDLWWFNIETWWFMMIQPMVIMIQPRNRVIYSDSTKKTGDLQWFNRQWRSVMISWTNLGFDEQLKASKTDLGTQNGDIARNIEAGTQTRRWGVLWEVERWGLLAK